ncbi:MAG: LytTR family DNA-binding domain-containing protein [Lachnospiraceae bacterium]|nr:LytTR family DNA-binding domain-containing protein [Lachnospiraceae bacterium]
MKIRIEMDSALTEDEIIFHCHELTEEILKLQKVITESISEQKNLILKKQGTEYFIPLEQILFFETDAKIIYAHTSDNMYETDYKLYELECLLPGFFMRISKSAIVNTKMIYSITRNLTASSTIEFSGTPKQVYVSRQYYKLLMERLNEHRTHQ